MIDLHYWPTPDGKKVTILLEECELPYRIVPCRIGEGDQFKDEFLAISPNNRMPAMVDHEPEGEGEPIALFESGAIMLYIAEKAGSFYPQSLRERHEVNQWVIWQMANQGPKFGEFGHFRRLRDEQGDQSYALRRLGDEVHRLYEKCEELAAELRILEEGASHDAVRHPGIHVLHAAPLHAVVIGLHHDGDSVGLHLVLQQLGELGDRLFLDLRPRHHPLHQAGVLRKADERRVLVRHHADPDPTDDRAEMVGARAA